MPLAVVRPDVSAALEQQSYNMRFTCGEKDKKVEKRQKNLEN